MTYRSKEGKENCSEKCGLWIIWSNRTVPVFLFLKAYHEGETQIYMERGSTYWMEFKRLTHYKFILSRYAGWYHLVLGGNFSITRSIQISLDKTHPEALTEEKFLEWTAFEPTRSMTWIAKTTLQTTGQPGYQPPQTISFLVLIFPTVLVKCLLNENVRSKASPRYFQT